MKRATLIVLAILVMATMVVAQDGTQAVPTAGANTTWYNVDQNNGHIRHGCMLCHAPHSANASISSAAVKPVGGSFNLGNFDPTYTGGTIASITTGYSGGPVAGAIYLWGTALTAQTYTTWDGTQISQANITNGKYSAVVHTLLCMSCHDNANSSYLMGMGFGKNPANSTSEFGVTNVVEDGFGDHIGLSTIVNGPAWNTTSTLQNSHPVHAVYAGSYNWKINSNGTFIDTAFQLDATHRGHPAKLWMEGATAYVECTTCHDPHRETAFAYWNGTNYTIGSANSTIFYLRGPYTDPTSGNGNTNANFCRSCHYSKSAAYAAVSGAPQ